MGRRAGRQAWCSSARPRWGFRGPRSFALPEFDPFWQKVVEADVLVAMHSSDSGYERHVNEWLGNDREYLPFKPTRSADRGCGVPSRTRCRHSCATARSSRFPR